MNKVRTRIRQARSIYGNKSKLSFLVPIQQHRRFCAVNKPSFGTYALKCKCATLQQLLNILFPGLHVNGNTNSFPYLCNTASGDRTSPSTSASLYIQIANTDVVLFLRDRVAATL